MTTNPELVTIADIDEAAARIADLALRTPVIDVPHPDDPDRLLACKAESLQPTGAFKVRGAYNALALQLDEARARGVVTASSGNHGRAIAWLARQLGLRAVVVIPDAAPAIKVEAVRALGARVELVPAAERDTRPGELVEAEGLVYVPPYDDLRVIAGQGTVGRELVHQVAGLDVVLVPVSGGGLISGVATAVKALSPQTQVIGVEPELAADAAESYRLGRRVTWSATDTYRTVADGLRVTSLGSHPWEHVQRYVDDVVTVTEEEILAAVRHLALAGRLVAEPSGATAAAAWLAGRSPAGARTAAIVSGGCVDPALLARVLA